MEGDNVHGVSVSTLLRRLRSDSKSQRYVGHVVDDDSLVLSRVLCDAAQAALQDVMAVEELLLGAGLEPDLEFGVGGEEIGGGNVKPEFPSFCHFAEASAEGKKLLPVDRRRQLHHVCQIRK